MGWQSSIIKLSKHVLFILFLNLYIINCILIANINDLKGLITPLHLYTPEEKVNSHGPYLDFEWVIRKFGRVLWDNLTAMGHFK